MLFRSLRSSLPVLALLSLGSCAANYTILLRNRASQDFVPYPVVTDPPPPHREADPANTLAHNSEVSMEPAGFNPVYLHEPSLRGFAFQFSLDLDPPQILVRLYQHAVPPGQEGSDPAKQPQLLDEQLFEPVGEDLIFTVRPDGQGFPIEMTEGTP